MDLRDRQEVITLRVKRKKMNGQRSLWTVGQGKYYGLNSNSQLPGMCS